MKKKINKIVIIAVIISLIPIKVFGNTYDVYNMQNELIGTSNTIEGCVKIRENSKYKDEMCSIRIRENGMIWTIGAKEINENEIKKVEIKNEEIPYHVVKNGNMISNREIKKLNTKAQTREEAIRKSRIINEWKNVENIEKEKVADKPNIIISEKLKEKIEKQGKK